MMFRVEWDTKESVEGNRPPYSNQYEGIQHVAETVSFLLHHGNVTHIEIFKEND